MDTAKFEHEGLETILEGSEQEIAQAAEIRKSAFDYVDEKIEQCAKKVGAWEEKNGVPSDEQQTADPEWNDLKEDLESWVEVGDGINTVFQKSKQASGIIRTKKNYESAMLERLQAGIKIRRQMDREDAATLS